MRLHWASEHQGLGNALGHSLGAAIGKQAAIDAGITIDPNAPIALHHCPPHCFKPIPGKINILWCAWEFRDITPPEVDGLKRADVVFCTARFLRDLFERESGVPTYYVRQGIRTDLFQYAERKAPVAEQRFRYLWVGAPNDRKGWKHLFMAWKRAFAADPTCELFIKTTFGHTQMESGHFGNCIIETTPYSDADMVKLYHSAHAFVFPSMGEGFGFTLGEAMATGLPCVTTLAGGCGDLADASCTYPVSGRWGKCFDMPFGGKTYRLTAFSASIDALIQRMKQVRREYGKALEVGKRAADRIRENFTWTHAGRELRERIELVAAQMPTMKGKAA